MIASRAVDPGSTALPSIGGQYRAVLLTSAVLITRLYGAEKRLLPANMLKDPVLVAFTTSSSEAPIRRPSSDCLERRAHRLVRPADWLLVQPRWLDGSLLLLAAMFIAQAHNVPLSFSEITVMMLTLMLA